MTDERKPNGESAALKIICVGMAGIISTALFMWLTFPRDLATASQITTLATQIQKQLDNQQAKIDQLNQHLSVDDSEINLLKYRAGLK